MLGQERGRVLWEKLGDAMLDVSLSGPDEPNVLYHVSPAVAEIGVYKGGTALLLRYCAPHRHLLLFDTFQGHPPGNREHDVAMSQPAGRFGDASLGEVAALLAPTLRFDGVVGVTVYAGAFPATLCGAGLPGLCFAHVDCALYDSVAAACRAFWPALEHGGVLLFDDYNFPDCIGAKRAVDEWVAVDPNMRELHLPGTGQAW